MAEWTAYAEQFVKEDGRVVDNVNGGISHSESQGYGLLLAYSAGDRAGFERIWGFTSNELLIRSDRLAAWKWDAAAKPHVVDVNNASDGDILIAYALGLAGEDWKDQRYTDAARKLALAIGDNLLTDANNRVVLRPGAEGFGRSENTGTLIVNASYWIFEAFPTLEKLAPDHPWQQLASSGAELINAARFGPAKLPSDWIAISAEGLRPAPDFPAVYGYNAIRIPLYLLRAGAKAGPLLDNFEQAAQSLGPAIVDIASGHAVEKLADPGYRMIDAALDCAYGTPIPKDLLRFEPTAYYPSTLHLLGLSYVRERQPQCL
ncbi:MAG: endoglucanase [Bauldia sp.]|nr:endoglucanase [Bauldia sp.]